MVALSFRWGDTTNGSARRYTRRMITAYVLVSAMPARIAGLGQEIADLVGVVEVHSVAGSDVALVAKLVVESHEDIASVVTEHIAQLDGIVQTQTLIAFRRYSDTQIDAMYEGFGD